MGVYAVREVDILTTELTDRIYYNAEFTDAEILSYVISVMISRI
jgi:hypothetical protein